MLARDEIGREAILTGRGRLSAQARPGRRRLSHLPSLHPGR
nr:hypothetical protein [Actinomyces naeslundii]